MDAPRKSPGAAFLLSIIPGAGHVYAGSTGPGVIWLGAVVFAWADTLGWLVLGPVIMCAIYAQFQDLFAAG